MWIDSVALTDQLPLYPVYVGVFQASGWQNGIAAFVSLDSKQYISAIEIQQVVRKGTDRAHDCRLDSRIPGCLELSSIVFHGSGMDQVLKGNRKAAPSSC